MTHAATEITDAAAHAEFVASLTDNAPVETPPPVVGVHPANPLSYLKAVVAVLLAALSVAYVALNDGVITPQEWIEIVTAGLTSGAAVYGIPNVASK